MRPSYQARWISKDRAHSLKKAGSLKKGVLLDNYSGFIVVEPIGSNLGDGPVLAKDVADAELQPAWCFEKVKVVTARQLLGLAGLPNAM